MMLIIIIIITVTIRDRARFCKFFFWEFLSLLCDIHIRNGMKCVVIPVSEEDDNILCVYVCVLRRISGFFYPMTGRGGREKQVFLKILNYDMFFRRRRREMTLSDISHKYCCTASESHKYQRDILRPVEGL